MATFPTLSTTPLVQPYKQSRAANPTITSEKCAGYKQTRAEFTRLPKRWHIAYGDATAADKAALESLEQEVSIGAGAFSWTDPIENQTYDVRIVSPNGIDYAPGQSDGIWRIEFDIEEV